MLDYMFHVADNLKKALLLLMCVCSGVLSSSDSFECTRLSLQNTHGTKKGRIVKKMYERGK